MKENEKCSDCGYNFKIEDFLTGSGVLRKSDANISSRSLPCVAGMMELTEIGKDCKEQIWSRGRSRTQFCDLSKTQISSCQFTAKTLL